MNKHQVNLSSLKVIELTNLSYFLLKDESYRNDEYFIWPLGLYIYKLQIQFYPLVPQFTSGGGGGGGAMAFSP